MRAKYRAKLSSNPEAAIVIWRRLIDLARQQQARDQWQKAIVCYGHALDTARFMFADNPDADSLNRYIRSACELAYRIRQCDPLCDLQLIIAGVNNTVEKYLYPVSTQLLLRPLLDIAFAPLVEVHCWMQALYEIDEVQGRADY